MHWESGRQQASGQRQEADYNSFHIPSPSERRKPSSNGHSTPSHKATRTQSTVFSGNSRLPFSIVSIKALHSSPNGGRSLAGGRRSSFWYIACQFWNGKVETDVLSSFNRTAMLTHDSFEIRFGRSSSAAWANWLTRYLIVNRSL